MNQRFKSIIAETLKTDQAALDGNPLIRNVPGWDSLSHWIVINKLEEEYGIEFTIDEATGFEKVEEIYEVVVRKLEN